MALRNKTVVCLASLGGLAVACIIAASCKPRKSFDPGKVSEASPAPTAGAGLVGPNPVFNTSISAAELALLGSTNAAPQCAVALGALPDFTCVDNDLDLVDPIVPNLIDKTYTRAVETFVGHVGTAEAPYVLTTTGLEECLNRAQLGTGRCYPGSRMGTLPSFDRDGKLMPDIKTGFLCRRTKTYPIRPAIKYVDLAIIQTNVKTGESCFYQYLNETTDEKVPSPFKWDSLKKLSSADATTVAAGRAEIAAGADFFSTTGDGCISCHDSDPFIHTRYTESVIRNGVELTRPMIPQHIWGLKSNYKIISAPTAKAKHVFVKDETNIKDGRNKCTSCHKIGVEKSCREINNDQWFGKFLVGHDKVTPAQQPLWDAGKEAINACCAAYEAGGSTGGDFTAKTASGKELQCGTAKVPL